MRKRLIIWLAIVNGLFALVLLATPANTQVIPFAIFDCCKEDKGGIGYCCRRCCWFIQNCKGDGECQK